MSRGIYAKRAGRLGGGGVRHYPGQTQIVPFPGGPAYDSTLLKDYLLNEWLPALRVDVEPTTFRGCNDHVRTLINPHLGSIPVSDISQRMLREFYQELLRTPCRRGTGLLSKNSVIRVHATLSWALQSLVEAGRLPANPAWGARPRLKKSERYEPRIWPPDVLCRFLEYCSDDELFTLWNILALTGMRRGEVLGLQWGDFSTRYTHVSVKRALCQAGGSRYVSAPKGAQGRNIDLLRSTAASLRLHRRRMMRRRRDTRRARLQPSDFVFVRRSGDHLSPTGVSKKFNQLVKRGGFPRIRLHDLRHTHASHLLEAGANLKAVQERLGHADPVFTIDTYVHLMPTVQAEAIKSLDKFYRDLEKSS